MNTKTPFGLKNFGGGAWDRRTAPDEAKKQAPPLAKKVCLSTDDFFLQKFNEGQKVINSFQERYNEGKLIIEKLQKEYQYPVDAPENLNWPDKLKEIERYKEWARLIYNLSSDLNDIADHFCGLGKDDGQIESNHIETQQADDFGGYDKPSDYL